MSKNKQGTEDIDMGNIPLFKYTNITDELSKIEVGLNTGYTSYADDNKTKDAYDKIRNKFREWLLPENLVVLTGAGASITCGERGASLDTKNEKYTGKTVGMIWEAVKEGLDSAKVEKLLSNLDEDKERPNLEAFISKLETYISANQKNEESGMKQTVADCKEVKDKIIETLKIECKLELHESAPHAKMLRTVLSARKRSQPRLKVFTLNYDTLFEKAAERINSTIIDGFSFTRTPTFNGSNFDLDVVRRERHRIHHQENYEEKVFQLYKLHGSLDWENDNGAVVRKQEFADDPLIIPPSTHKFEQSYEMPFFEMMSRFQQVLRKENTVLLIIGYGFGDGHINRVILEALASNLNFEMVAISPTITGRGNNETINKLHEKIDNGQPNITLISDTFQRFALAMPTITSSEDDKTAHTKQETIMPPNTEETQNDGIPF